LFLKTYGQIFVDDEQGFVTIFHVGVR
jgi:hypothetical protein